MALQSITGLLNTSHPLPSCGDTPIINFQNCITANDIVTIAGVGDLRAVDATPDGIVWVGGTLGKVAKSMDGGRSWRAYAPSDDAEGVYLDFRAVCVLDADTACVMSAGESEYGLARVLRTENGGRDWTSVLCPKQEGFFFNAMKFWDAKRGILLGDPIDRQFVLYKTEDGGKSWSRLIPLSMPAALSKESAFAVSNSSLEVYGENQVWFCTGHGAEARLFFSRDAGQTWNVTSNLMQLDSESSGLFSISFKSEREGIAVGGDFKSKFDFLAPNIFRTIDGGSTWSAIQSKELSGRYLSSVAYNAKGEAYIIDGSTRAFNALVFVNNRGYAVGPNQNVAILQ